MSKRNFVIDSVKTIFSSLLIAFGLQMIAYPFLVNKLGSSEFGHILTIYTILTIATVVLGNTLNNIRLINMNTFKPNVIYSIFLKLLVISISIETVGLVLIIYFYFNLTITTILFLVVINLLMCIRIYSNVFYRMKLEYNKLLLISIAQFVGIGFGIFLFNLTNRWEFIFLFSEIFGLMYIIYTLRNYFISLQVDKSNSLDINKDYLMLLGTNLLNNINLYLDRLILLPIVGGTAVTASYLATFIGKIIASFLYPINNVILSYISVNKIGNKFKQYMLVIFIGLILSLIVLSMCYPITILIVEHLYKQDSDSIKNIIIIGNMAILLGVISNMVQSLNIKYINMRIQTIFQVLFSIFYIVITTLVTYLFGIFGFFIATLIANGIKVILLTTLGIKYSNKEEIN
ncbi:capsular biosynthesis protein [Mammaliicoccus vitulinus]|uniref:capsular biosynthesis protein n=2 Tax=Mammaliicoccus vitulinus TaxID=71237 RepID=UPI0016655099|nr:capsular biosynthesis protein [Mammaliicoccus vitulinus]QQT15406.1 capsular biosynthesis protein [Mammaliicoccus vitulinus]QQY19290.1 capsular biosynthesis protein [Mammaliicoccus vitulinus]GGI03678.1 capsular polysaccharide biosynthesis protein [Mammaliicoccus vitulinus]